MTEEEKKEYIENKKKLKKYRERIQAYEKVPAMNVRYDVRAILREIDNDLNLPASEMEGALYSAKDMYCQLTTPFDINFEKSWYFGAVLDYVQTHPEEKDALNKVFSAYASYFYDERCEEIKYIVKKYPEAEKFIPKTFHTQEEFDEMAKNGVKPEVIEAEKAKSQKLQNENNHVKNFLALYEIGTQDCSSRTNRVYWEMAMDTLISETICIKSQKTDADLGEIE